MFANYFDLVMAPCHYSKHQSANRFETHAEIIYSVKGRYCVGGERICLRGLGEMGGIEQAEMVVHVSNRCSELNEW